MRERNANAPSDRRVGAASEADLCLSGRQRPNESPTTHKPMWLVLVLAILLAGCGSDNSQTSGVPPFHEAPATITKPEPGAHCKPTDLPPTAKLGTTWVLVATYVCGTLPPDA
jgi:hypothetical protein